MQQKGTHVSHMSGAQGQTLLQAQGYEELPWYRRVLQEKKEDKKKEATKEENHEIKKILQNIPQEEQKH